MRKGYLSIIGCLFLLFLVSCDNGGGPGPEIESRFPESKDLRESNVLTSVKDQGDFGTCWSFAPNALFETLIKRDLGEEVDLSEQFLINSVAMGAFNAMDLAMETGLITEEKCPYEGSQEADYEFEGNLDFKIGSYTTLLFRDMDPETIRDTIKAYLTIGTPVVTHMTLYNDFQRYQRGVYEYDGVSQASDGHIILIVGWQDDPSVSTGGCWIVKNSWGSSWGENGYFRIAYDDTEFADQYGIIAEDPYRISDNTLVNNTDHGYHTKWSPTGTHISYTTRDNEGAKIWVHDFSSGESSVLVDGMEGDMTMNWNAAGTKITFEAYDNNNTSQIWTVDISTRETFQVTHNQGPSFQPEWNKTNNSIVYSSQNNLWVINPDGSNNSQLTTDNRGYSVPAYSWDGNFIVFERYSPSNIDIYMIDSDGTNERQITSHEARDDRPRFSPDGTEIVFESWRNSTREEIWIYTIATGALRQVTFPSHSGAMPDYSPDGSQLVITVNLDGYAGAWIVNL